MTVNTYNTRAVASALMKIICCLQFFDAVDWATGRHPAGK